jgi:hypothetical protein
LKRDRIGEREIEMKRDMKGERDRIGEREEREMKRNRDRERKRKREYTETVGDRRYIKKESFTHKK